MRRALLLLLLPLLLAPAPAAACFGPKLYLAAPAGAQGDVLFALVALYLKEKTGVETVRVDLAGAEPQAALRAERADLAFAATGEGTVLLAVDGLPPLRAGQRPLTDLRFTTVPAALRKLAGLLKAAQVAELTAEVDRGASAAAVARRFFAAGGWL
jgi:hypothetical protein